MILSMSFSIILSMILESSIKSVLGFLLSERISGVSPVIFVAEVLINQKDCKENVNALSHRANQLVT